MNRSAALAAAPPEAPTSATAPIRPATPAQWDARAGEPPLRAPLRRWRQAPSLGGRDPAVGARLDQPADRGEGGAVGERPVQQRRGRTPAAVRAGHLGHDVGLASPGGRADEGLLGGDRVAVLDADRPLVVVEQPVVVVDPEAWQPLAVAGPAAGEECLLGGDVPRKSGASSRRDRSAPGRRRCWSGQACPGRWGPWPRCRGRPRPAAVAFIWAKVTASRRWRGRGRTPRRCPRPSATPAGAFGRCMPCREGCPCGSPRRERPLVAP